MLLYLRHAKRYLCKQENDNPDQLTPLRKLAYSNILKILPPKPENFQIKKSVICHISAQNIYCVSR